MTGECQEYLRTVTALGSGGIEVKRKNQAQASLLRNVCHMWTHTQTEILG